LGSIGRQTRAALAAGVIAVLGGNSVVLLQRSSAAAGPSPVLRTTGTTPEPAADPVGQLVAMLPDVAPSAEPVHAAVSLRHDDGPHVKNTPDKAPVPKPAPSTKPIVGMLDGPEIEGYARYEGQSTCDPTPKPGTVALRNLLLSRYPATVSFGISRACDVGGRSEHKEGRAFDWGANVNNPGQRAAVENFIAALFATDSYGHHHALARRMGVMYVIWNQQIWGAYQADAGWQPYSGDSPHTDHMHISLSWAGARAETSFYSGKVVPGLPDGTNSSRKPTGTRQPPTTTTGQPPRTRRPRPSSTTTPPTTGPPSSTTTTRWPSTTWRTTTTTFAP
jgi:hypothetical protein